MFRLIPLLFSMPAWAHVEETSAAFHMQWSFEPWVILCLCLSLGLYLMGMLRLWRKANNSKSVLKHQLLFFWLGWLTLVIALVSPLDPLGVHLFSAHMVQHELMMIVAAPLLVMSRPFGVWLWALPPGWRESVSTACRKPAIALSWNFLTNSLAAWTLHALILWIWHAPAFFDTALVDNDIHTLQHTSFLVTALFFWWTVLRDGATKSGCGIAIVYLFTTMMHTGALGALLTFSATPWYSGYVYTSTALGWEPLVDQQLGGLIMWIPGGLVYMGAALMLGARWLQLGQQSRSMP